MAEFAWRDITVSFLGRTIEGILDITYEKEEEKKAIYGRGGKVIGIQRGNEKCTAEITLRQSEVEAMTTAVKSANPNATLLDVEFDVQIHYVKLGSATIIKDRIVAAQFTKIPKGMKQGDTDMEIKLPLLCEDILYNQE